MKKHIIVIISSLILNVFFCCAQSPAVKRVMTTFNCSEMEAEDFLVQLSKNIDIIQHRFSEIANSNVGLITKNQYIDELLVHFFAQGATIGISSTKGSYVNVRRVSSYLNDLKNMSMYKSVQLYFDTDYLDLGAIERLQGKNRYTFNIGVKQYFKGVTLEGITYMDMTYKNIQYVLEKNGSDFYFKIKHIKVKETSNTTNREFQNTKEKHIDRFRTTNND